MLPVGRQAHNHVRHILNGVAGLGGGPAADGQANNGHDTELTATTTPSTSAAPVSTSTRGQRATASPSTSAARGHGWPATASPSTSVARGCGRPATASPRTSAVKGRGRPATANRSISASRGRGWRATIPWVVTSPEIPAPILYASP